MNKTPGNGASRALKIVLAGVIFFGLFFQVGMLAKISGQTKKASQVEKEMVELEARRENLQLALNQLKNPARIESLALKLGMVSPGEGEIRVVSIPNLNAAADAQTAEIATAEGVYQ